MNQITCFQTYVPIRSEPSHRSEQVSQLIFGESATIIEKKNEWYLVKTDFDNYEGWIEQKVVSPYQQTENEAIICKSVFIKTKNYGNILLPAGARVSFKTNKSILINDTAIEINPEEIITKPDFNAIIGEFLGAPYLWGGRTLFGIDCSGFTQIVMKCLEIILPRDASQQVNLGDEVPFVNQAGEGDLAFFDNEEGKIVHTGIVLKDNRIIHSSGQVRIDKLDQQGIFNKTLKKYTHRLRIIKKNCN